MFDDDKFYAADDPALQAIAPVSTLASWRHERRGPAFHRWGKRVFYSGRDLNAFIAAHRVATRDSERATA